MNKIKHLFKNMETGKLIKNIRWIKALIFSLLFLFSFIYIYLTWTSYKTAIEDHAIVTAKNIELSMNGEMIKLLTATPQDKGTIAYESVKNRLISLVQINKDVRFAYVYTLKAGEVHLMVDSEPVDSEDYSPPGQKYYEASESIYKAFEKGQSLITQPETDRWGTWISVLIPMDDYNGQTFAVFGMDYPANLFYIEAKNHTIIAAIIVIFAWLILYAFLLVIKNNRKLKFTEEQQRLLLSEMPLGVAFHEIICDDKGMPTDYRFISCNESFTKLTGLKQSDILGKTVLQVLPNTEKSWIDKYGQVALTQKSIQFEDYSKELNKIFLVNAYSPKPGYFATIFDDITIKRKNEIEIRENEKLFQKMLAVVPDLISIQDKDMNIMYSNWQGFGAVPEDKRLINSKCYSTYRCNEEMCSDCPFRITIENKQTTECELKLTDGRWLEIHVIPSLDDKNEIEYFVEWVRDISNRKQMEQLLFNENEKFRTTLLSVGDAVISTDQYGKIRIINEIAEKLTGWTQKEAYGKPLHEVLNIISEKTGKQKNDIIELVLNTKDIVELGNHTILISKNEQKIPIEDSAAPIKDRNGDITGVVLVFRDVTEKKQKKEELEFFAFHDQLTEVYNRRFYTEELKRLNSTRNMPLSLIMIDVNGLKLVNDSFGHLAGDAVLKKAAQIIKKACREDDIIARVGGDEFIVLLPKTDAEQAKAIIDRINLFLEKENIEFLGVPLSLAFGQETKIKIEEDMEEIFKKAEARMYKNKLLQGVGIGENIINTIILTLHEKNKREEEHSKRVSELSIKLGKALALPEDKIEELKMTGWLHDIGKITINENILNKPGRLTKEEWKEMKRHVTAGFRILKSVRDMADIAEHVLSHHERWDGSGYPKGLKGEEIPLESRIIAIADAFDAMTGQRTYKEILTTEEAVEEIINNSGTQFDPRLARIFIEKVIDIT